MAMFGSGMPQQAGGSDWMDKLAILGAILQDAGAAYGGRPGTAVSSYQNNQKKIADQKNYQNTIGGLFGAQNINNVQSTAQMPMQGAGAELANRQAAGAYDAPVYGGAIGGLPGSTQQMLAQMLPQMSPEAGMTALFNSTTASQDRADKLADRAVAANAAKKPGEAVHEAINPTTGNMGQYRFGADGDVEWLNTGVAPKAPTTRTIRMGTQDITQEFNPITGQWTQVAKGAAFKPDAPDKGAAPPSGYRYGAGGNLEFIPGGPADPAVAGRGSGKPTEDQAKNTQLYTRAKEQLPIALENFDALSNAGNQFGAAVSGIPLIGPSKSVVTGKQYQRASGALNDIATSYLYSVSGATATPSEIAGTVERVTPKFGDDAQTIADKKQRLIQMVESIKYRASPQTLNQPQQPANGGWGIRKLP